MLGEFECIAQDVVSFEQVLMAATSWILSKYSKKKKNPAAVTLGRLGGSVKSAKKAAASRRNGFKKGNKLAKRKATS